MLIECSPLRFSSHDISHPFSFQPYHNRFSNAGSCEFYRTSVDTSCTAQLQLKNRQNKPQVCSISLLTAFLTNCLQVLSVKGKQLGLREPLAPLDQLCSIAVQAVGHSKVEMTATLEIDRNFCHEWAIVQQPLVVKAKSKLDLRVANHLKIPTTVLRKTVVWCLEVSVNPPGQ